MNNEDIHGPVPEDIGDGSGLPTSKEKQAFQNITRELSDDDLTNPAVGKLLLDERDRLEIENDELKKRLENENDKLSNYREKFHEADKKVAVLQEKNKTHLATEIISAVCFTIGAVLIGYAPVLWKSQPSGWIALALGSILIIGGIVAKVVKR